jgi:hypothetical protein
LKWRILKDLRSLAMPFAGDDFAAHLLKMAAGEAVASGSPQIIPTHLLIALSKLSEEQSSSGGEDHSAALRREFESMGIEPRRFRRRLRALLPKGQDGSPGSIVHRSETAKAVFTLGNALAEAPAEPGGPVHLLRAIFLLLADAIPSGKGRPAGLDVWPADDEIPHEL